MTGDSDSDGTSDTGSGEEKRPEPTAQPEALRRQQFYVGACGGVIAGLALMAGLFQQFPGLPTPAVVLAGVLGTGFVLWLVKKSVFPGEGELADA